MDDLEESGFSTLPDETWVDPGHRNDTTLGRERPSLPEWRARLAIRRWSRCLVHQGTSRSVDERRE
jgi:hypothetical protein